MSNLDFIAVAIKPCAKCGSLERNPKRECRACAVARSKAWRDNNAIRAKETSKKWRETNAEDQNKKSSARRAANPEQHKACVAAWASKNKEKRRVDNAAWAVANKDKVVANGKAWRANNKDATKVINQNRRARKQKSGCQLSRGIIKQLFALQQGKCPCCGLSLEVNYHLDHIIPLALGGAHSNENMQLLRAKCNMSKRAMHPIDYMQRKGFLI